MLFKVFKKHHWFSIDSIVIFLDIFVYKEAWKEWWHEGLWISISWHLRIKILFKNSIFIVNSVTSGKKKKARVGWVRHLALASAANAQCRQDLNTGFLTLLLDVNYLRPVPSNAGLWAPWACLYFQVASHPE